MILQFIGPLENDTAKKTTASLPGAVSEITASEISKTVVGSVVIYEGTYQGKPIRVRIFNDPTQKSE